MTDVKGFATQDRLTHLITQTVSSSKVRNKQQNIGKQKQNHIHAVKLWDTTEQRWVQPHVCLTLQKFIFLSHTHTHWHIHTSSLKIHVHSHVHSMWKTTSTIAKWRVLCIYLNSMSVVWQGGWCRGNDFCDVIRAAVALMLFPHLIEQRLQIGGVGLCVEQWWRSSSQGHFGLHSSQAKTEKHIPMLYVFPFEWTASLA